MNSHQSLNALQRHLERLLPRLHRAPPGVLWRRVRSKPAEPRRAELVRSSGCIETTRGELRYRAGKHYIVHYGPGDRAPMRRSVFERLYKRRADGRYDRRRDVLLRYFTLSYPVLVETQDGAELAHPGDWIMEGASDDLWAVAAQDAREEYERA
jgi:hypothetical protein